MARSTGSRTCGRRGSEATGPFNRCLLCLRSLSTGARLQLLGRLLVLRLTCLILPLPLLRRIFPLSLKQLHSSSSIDTFTSIRNLKGPLSILRTKAKLVNHHILRILVKVSMLLLLWSCFSVSGCRMSATPLVKAIPCCQMLSSVVYST
jgi:hypothetical protein